MSKEQTPIEKAIFLVNQFIPYAMIGYKDEGEYEKHTTKICHLSLIRHIGFCEKYMH